VDLRLLRQQGGLEMVNGAPYYYTFEYALHLKVALIVLELIVIVILCAVTIADIYRHRWHR
jgi:hypothetical protein